MTAPAIPDGMKPCPGWDSDYGYKGPGNPMHAGCGLDSFGRRQAYQQLIPDRREMCDRCHRQKQKWEGERGKIASDAERKAAEQKARIALFVADLGADHSWTMGNLGSVLEALGRLHDRGTYPPFELRPSYSLRSDRISAIDQIAVLRSIAGIEATE